MDCGSLKEWMLPCFYKAFLGIDCPLCGFQRSFLLLIEGNFKASFLMYPPLFPVLLFIGIALFWLFSNKKSATQLIKISVYIILLLVGLNYCFNLFLKVFST